MNLPYFSSPCFLRFIFFQTFLFQNVNRGLREFLEHARHHRLLFFCRGSFVPPMLKLHTPLLDLIPFFFFTDIQPIWDASDTLSLNRFPCGSFRMVFEGCRAIRGFGCAFEGSRGLAPGPSGVRFFFFFFFFSVPLPPFPSLFRS